MPTSDTVLDDTDKIPIDKLKRGFEKAFCRLAEYLQTVEPQALMKIKSLPGIIELIDNILKLDLLSVKSLTLKSMNLHLHNSLPPRELAINDMKGSQPVLTLPTEIEQGGGGCHPREGNGDAPTLGVDTIKKFMNPDQYSRD